MDNVLLVDVGNSRLKWALAEGAELNGHGCAQYQLATLAETLDRSPTAGVQERTSGKCSCKLKDKLRDCRTSDEWSIS